MWYKLYCFRNRGCISAMTLLPHHRRRPVVAAWADCGVRPKGWGVLVALTLGPKP